MATTIKDPEELRDRINRGARESGVTAAGLLERLLDGDERRRRMEIYGRVRLRGPALTLSRPTFAMTEQPRTITRERIDEVAGVVDADTMREVDTWLRDFLALP